MLHTHVRVYYMYLWQSRTLTFLITQPNHFLIITLNFGIVVKRLKILESDGAFDCCCRLLGGGPKLGNSLLKILSNMFLTTDTCAPSLVAVK